MLHYAHLFPLLKLESHLKNITPKPLVIHLLNEFDVQKQHRITPSQSEIAEGLYAAWQSEVKWFYGNAFSAVHGGDVSKQSGI